MADMMGVANMGGPAVDFTPEFPTPTIERGATMAEAMKAMGHDMGSRPVTDEQARDDDTEVRSQVSNHRARERTSTRSSGAVCGRLQALSPRRHRIRRWRGAAPSAATGGGPNSDPAPADAIDVLNC